MQKLVRIDLPLYKAYICSCSNDQPMPEGFLSEMEKSGLGFQDGLLFTESCIESFIDSVLFQCALTTASAYILYFCVLLSFLAYCGLS